MTTKALVVLSVGAAMWGICAASGADLYDEGVLAVLELRFPQSNWYTLLTNNYQSKTDLAATLTVDGVVYEGVGVRFRGNTSYQMVRNSQKKSFNISIDYTFPDQRLMGYKTLNLLNCNNDATFMREVLYSNMCRRQVPSAKANFVRLVINGENWGGYANVQQLNAQFLNDWFASNDGTQWRGDGMGAMGGGNTGGVTPGGGGVTPIRRSVGDIGIAEGGVTTGVAALTWQGANVAPYQSAYELKSTHQADPWASLIRTCDVLNNTPLAQLPDKIESVLNVDGALWFCAFEIIFADDDGYVNKRGSDYGLYYEPETGRIHLMQYDGNECMGATTWPIFYRADDSSVPIMNRLLSIPKYRQRYLAHVRTILNTHFTTDLLNAKIDAYRALIEAEVAADTKKLYTTQEFLTGVTVLKSFVQTRRTAILANSEVNRASPIINSVDQEVTETPTGQSLLVTVRLGTSVPVSGVQLYVAPGPFALFSSVPMIDLGEQTGGGISERVFSLALDDYPAGTVLRYYIEAKAADSAGTVVYSPEGAEHEVYRHLVTYPHGAYSEIVINEVMSKNVAVVADPQGEYDDWIELKNISDHAINLAGMYLSDSLDKPLKWRFPEGTVLGPGEYLLIWADEDGQDEPGLHANFKLSAQGETIWLFDTIENGHILLDSITIDRLEGDQSYARYPDGTGVMQISSIPTPLGANTVPLGVQGGESPLVP
ncbi:MAG: CotH kinase family protein [Phycisphaerae bacterium]|nr:CotH kinase family protein [Phycisphaerae bacterium]